MSAYQTDPRVDEYIATLPGWQQDICRQVRDLVHAADPDVTETIKRTRQPYFTLQGNIYARFRANGHLTIFILDRGCFVAAVPRKPSSVTFVYPMRELDLTRLDFRVTLSDSSKACELSRCRRLVMK